MALAVRGAWHGAVLVSGLPDSLQTYNECFANFREIVFSAKVSIVESVQLQLRVARRARSEIKKNLEKDFAKATLDHILHVATWADGKLINSKRFELQHFAVTRGMEFTCGSFKDILRRAGPNFMVLFHFARKTAVIDISDEDESDEESDESDEESESGEESDE